MQIAVFKEADKIWKHLTANADIEQFEFELAVHKRLVDFFQVGDYYYYVMQLATSSIVYASNEINTVLGYTPNDFSFELFAQKIHPEDQIHVLNFEHSGAKFLKQLPLSKLMKYKIRYDFRMQKKDGSFIRILHQSVVVQHDSNGIILTTMAVDTDISHLKKEGNPVLSFIGLDGEPSYIDVDVEQLFTPTDEVLSNREKEVLIQLIEGKLTKEVADTLNISTQTVDTHRKNMIRKANVKNTAELVAVAIRKGWV